MTLALSDSNRIMSMTSEMETAIWSVTLATIHQSKMLVRPQPVPVIIIILLILGIFNQRISLSLVFFSLSTHTCIAIGNTRITLRFEVPNVIFNVILSLSVPYLIELLHAISFVWRMD